MTSEILLRGMQKFSDTVGVFEKKADDVWNLIHNATNLDRTVLFAVGSAATNVSGCLGLVHAHFLNDLAQHFPEGVIRDNFQLGADFQNFVGTSGLVLGSALLGVAGVNANRAVLDIAKGVKE